MHGLATILKEQLFRAEQTRSSANDGLGGYSFEGTVPLLGCKS
jgi:hypothetical protein